MPGYHKKKNKQKKAHHNGEPHDHPHKKKEDLKKRLAKIGADNKRGDVDVDKNEQYKSIGSNEYYNKHDADMGGYNKDILDKVQLKNKKKVKKGKKVPQDKIRETPTKENNYQTHMDSKGAFEQRALKEKVKKAELTGVVKEQKKKKGKERLVHKASKGVDTYSSQDPKNSKVKKKHIKGKVSKQLIALRKKVNKIKNNPPQGPSGGTADTPESIIKDAEAVAKTPSYIAKDHDHAISFKGYKGESYKRASLISNTGKYAKYWLLNAKQTNGNGWGVSQQSIAKNIHKFVGKPLVVTAKSWIPNSEYGDAYEHPYLPTNDINKVFDHQEKFRVGSIVDIIEKDGDYYANIEINQKFAHMVMPPFCSPAIFQNNPSEPEGQISDWEALHLAALHEDPAYGSRIALLRGTCVGTQDQCTVQFKAAKQEAKMVCTKGIKERIATLKKNENLKQRIAGIQRTAFAGPPKDVIAAFREKKPLKFREKVKGRNKEYAFQTDGKTLYQSGFPIAQHTKKGIKFSYQSHPSATTAQAGRMLGINTFTKKGKTYVNGKEIDPNTDDYIEVPTKDIQEGTFKVNPNSTPAITEDKVKRNRDQEYFRNKSEKEALAGNQDLVVQTHKKKEVLDHGSITPEEQARINKITGLRNRAKRVYATDYHHSLPAEKGGGMGGGIFNRRVTSGAVPLSKKTHQEAHFPEKTIPKSFYSKLKQRLATLNIPKGGITGMEKHTTDFNNLKKQTKDMEGYTIHDGKLLDFNNQEHVNEFASAYPGKKGEHLYMVANTQNVRSIKDKILGTMQKDWENQGHPNTVLGGWKGQIDLNAVFRAKDSKQALEYAKKYNQEAITEINSVANTVNFIDNPSYKPKTQ